MLAVDKDHDTLVQILVDARADLNSKDEDG